MFLLLFLNVVAFASPKTEVQINICETYAAVSQKLNLQNWKPKAPEQSYFIENPSLDLFKQNWVFKVTVDAEHKTADVSLKFNLPLANANLEQNSELKNEKCEYDLHGDSKKMACKLSYSISYYEFERAQLNRDYSSLLSAEQLEWLRENKMTLPEQMAMTTAFTDQDFSGKSNDLKIVLGVSLGNKKEEFIEFSARSDEASEKETQNQLLEYLKNHDVKICKNQNSIYTRMKLESYFH